MNQLNKEKFLRQLDKNASKLIESYKILLTKSQVKQSDCLQNNLVQDELAVSISAANIVR